MKEIITQTTRIERIHNKMIKKIEKAGYYIEYHDWNEYCIRKEKGLFKPKLIVMFFGDEIRFQYTRWLKDNLVKSFVEELEKKTGLELVKYI